MDLISVAGSISEPIMSLTVQMSNRSGTAVAASGDCVRHGRDAGADTLARFEIALRLEQGIFALAGQARRGAKAVVIVDVVAVRPAKVSPSRRNAAMRFWLPGALSLPAINTKP